MKWLKEVDWLWAWIVVYSLFQLVDFSFNINSDKGVSVQVQSKPEEKKKEILVEDGPKTDW